MIIDGLPEKDVKDAMIDVISQYEEDVTDIAPESYFVNDEDADVTDDIEIEPADEDDDIPENDEDIDDVDDDVVPGEDFPDYDDVDDDVDDDVVPGEDFPDYDDVDDDVDDLDDEFECWDAENSCFTPLREKKEDCCPKKKHSMVNLSEAIKAFDPKKQKKVDDSVKTIEDIIKSVKG